MLCPSCGEKNQLGAQRCQSCGYAFTRQARGDHAAGRHAGSYSNDYRSRPSFANRRRRRGPLRAVVVLMLLLIIAAGAVIGAMLLKDSVVKPYVADQVSDDLDRGIREAVHQQVPEVPVNIGPTEVTITEEDINQRLANRENFGPLDQATVDVTPEGIEIALEAYGLSGTYSADLVAANGQLQLQNGSIDGPLGMLLPTSDLEAVANQAISGSLNDAGYQVNQVTLSDQALVIALR